jgi:hypothetical protein
MKLLYPPWPLWRRLLCSRVASSETIITTATMAGAMRAIAGRVRFRPLWRRWRLRLPLLRLIRDAVYNLRPRARARLLRFRGLPQLWWRRRRLLPPWQWRGGFARGGAESGGGFRGGNRSGGGARRLQGALGRELVPLGTIDGSAHQIERDIVTRRIVRRRRRGCLPQVGDGIRVFLWRLRLEPENRVLATRHARASSPYARTGVPRSARTR